jgi:hypothetical protein
MGLFTLEPRMAQEARQGLAVLAMVERDFAAWATSY